MAVIDASVYLALINANEPAHEQSWNWFQKTQSAQEKITAPTILLAEVGAALSRGHNNPLLAHKIIHKLEISSIIALIPITPTLAHKAATIAINQRIRGCDSIYVALAEQLNDYLITLDKQQLNRGAVVVKTREP